MIGLNMKMVELAPSLKKIYSDIKFGSLIVKNVQNENKSEVLEQQKQKLERMIQKNSMEPNQDRLIQNYNFFFNRWGKTYPIEFQIKTIKKGGKFPQVSVLVDCMFLAELQNRILTSGHDLDLIQGKLVFDITEGGEQYLNINGKKQELKKDDIILKDENGILASVLYGPAKRTAIIPKTKNALFFAWCPYGMDKELLTNHLNAILKNLILVFGSVSSELNIHT